MRSAAASPEWVSWSCVRLSGDVVRRRFNAKLRGAEDRTAYPILVVVAVPLNEADRGAASGLGESPRFGGLLDSLTEMIGDRAVLAGTTADSEAWVFFLYTARTGWLSEFEDRFRAAAGDHEVGFAVRDDQRWRAFRENCPPARDPRRDVVIALCLVPLIGLAGFRYGPIWGAGAVAAILAWLVPLARNRRDLISAGAANPRQAFAALAYVLATAVFGVQAMWGMRSPWEDLATAIGLGAVVTTALWPAQRRFYERMRARAALRAPAGLAG